VAHSVLESKAAGPPAATRLNRQLAQASRDADGLTKKYKETFGGSGEKAANKAVAKAASSKTFDDAERKEREKLAVLEEKRSRSPQAGGSRSPSHEHLSAKPVKPVPRKGTTHSVAEQLSSQLDVAKKEREALFQEQERAAEERADLKRQMAELARRPPSQ